MSRDDPLKLNRKDLYTFWQPDKASRAIPASEIIAVEKVHIRTDEAVGYAILRCRAAAIDFISNPRGYLDIRVIEVGSRDNPFNGKLVCSMYFAGNWEEMWVDELTTLPFDGSEIQICLKIPCRVSWPMFGIVKLE